MSSLSIVSITTSASLLVACADWLLQETPQSARYTIGHWPSVFNAISFRCEARKAGAQQFPWMPQVCGGGASGLGLNDYMLPLTVGVFIVADVCRFIWEDTGTEFACSLMSAVLYFFLLRSVFASYSLSSKIFDCSFDTR
jgi:hypothetical protein